MRKFIDLRVEANETDLMDFVKMCGIVQYLGAVGASREIRLKIDGDGSARFNFYIEGQKIPDTKVDTGHQDIFKVFIGE
jgi:hypothetical protein